MKKNKRVEELHKAIRDLILNLPSAQGFVLYVEWKDGTSTVTGTASVQSEDGLASLVNHAPERVAEWCESLTTPQEPDKENLN